MDLSKEYYKWKRLDKEAVQEAINIITSNPRPEKYGLLLFSLWFKYKLSDDGFCCPNRFINMHFETAYSLGILNYLIND